MTHSYQRTQRTDWWAKVQQQRWQQITTNVCQLYYVTAAVTHYWPRSGKKWEQTDRDTYRQRHSHTETHADRDTDRQRTWQTEWLKATIWQWHYRAVVILLFRFALGRSWDKKTDEEALNQNSYITIQRHQSIQETKAVPTDLHGHCLSMQYSR